AFRVVRQIADIRQLEAEVWKPGGDMLLAPFDLLRDDVEPFVAAFLFEVTGERHRDAPDAAPHVKHFVIGPKPAPSDKKIHEAPPRFAKVAVRIGRKAQKSFRRGQGITPASDQRDAVEHEAVEVQDRRSQILRNERLDTAFKTRFEAHGMWRLDQMRLPSTKIVRQTSSPACAKVSGRLIFMFAPSCASAGVEVPRL